jgi:nitrogen PTS system EIIA component
MEVTRILRPTSVRCGVKVGSKKQALDTLSEMLAEAAGRNAHEIFEGLVGRERLGCTSLGGPIAMPHARLADFSEPIGALLKLSQPVDFSAPDGEPIDLLFGLLVPQDASDKELAEIKEITRKLRDPQLKERLSTIDDPDLLYDAFTDSLTPILHV